MKPPIIEVINFIAQICQNSDVREIEIELSKNLITVMFYLKDDKKKGC